MKHVEKYTRQYFLPPVFMSDWVRKDHLDRPPIWCSVDLRDGNQALIEPMGLEEKLEFFRMLVEVGFKEIEVGFPAASETEYDFMRALIDRDMIPGDVTVQVLTQARPHIIKKTFEAVKGAPHAVIHLYNSTSVAQRNVVFRKNKEEIRRLATEGAKMLLDLAEKTEGDFSFEYSPESFHGTEVEYGLEVCNAVLDIWKPSADRKCIINIPGTVETAMPHVFASQIEYISKNLKYRDNVILSLHPHNDRGCAVADAELCCLAGVERVEGTLFGNGERTGNVDLVTLAMNLYSYGVDPGLDFSDMPRVRGTYERLTQMRVPARQPYAGDLVFSAFSGSHQDAIAKGMAARERETQGEPWTVPYLPIDPKDVGRNYDKDVIRINSQSGKGGVSYILQHNFALTLPAKMKESVGYAIKQVSDETHQELSPDEVYKAFRARFVDPMPYFAVEDAEFKRMGEAVVAQVEIRRADHVSKVEAIGNGRLDAASNAVKEFFGVSYELVAYEEHTLSRGSASKAIAYVGISTSERDFWGAGINEDILTASIHALCVAVNQLPKIAAQDKSADARLTDMLDFIRKNYRNVTLETMSKTFHLSEPYVSKYIREKSGKTFGEHVTAERMKRAKGLLKNGVATVESIAYESGYANVEHFNRTFKRLFAMTPLAYRNKENGLPVDKKRRKS